MLFPCQISLRMPLFVHGIGDSKIEIVEIDMENRGKFWITFQTIRGNREWSKYDNGKIYEDECANIPKTSNF